MNELIARATQEFVARFAGSPQLFSQSPGRINILGEHTDYTGGLSLPAAIDCWTVCAWRTREDDQLRIYSSNMNELWETSWSKLESSIDNQWKKYVGGSLLMFNEGSKKGFDLVILGNVPLGKGLSSSAAIELAVLNGLNLLYKRGLSPVDLTKLAQQVEHRFLHVKSGLLDQFTCQFSKPSSALLIDFETLGVETVEIAKEFSSCSWVLVDSMVKRELASSKYSERVEEYHTALKLTGKKSLRQLTSEELPSLLKNASENILKRARHIVSENERTILASQLLRRGQVEELGQLLYQTHRSLAEDYEVSHPNLDFMIEFSRRIPGVLGGRMMGGGFGGCGLFLVRTESVNDFTKTMATAYEKFSGSKTEPRTVQFVSGASAWA